MDLKNLIRPQLWNEISNSYIAENYKTSILDSMRYLSKIIREKSGLDGDGAQLAGQAFGGDEPKLRINKLQTQSEKDEQKGFLQIVSGLYSAIRNPRTHEDIRDDKNTVDPIIYFINYILTVIDVAKPPFTTENFLRRVFDADYVQSKEYTKELVKEIPKNKYLETLIEIYRNKLKINEKTLELISKEIIPNVKEDELKEFIAIVSDELDIVSDEVTIIAILRLFPNDLWKQLKLTARMRIENKLIKSIQSGKMEINHNSPKSGALGTWAIRIMENFTMKDELSTAVFYNLIDDDIRKIKYTANYFMDQFPLLLTEEYKYEFAIRAVRKLIEEGDTKTRWRIKKFADNCPEKSLQTLKEVFLIGLTSIALNIR